MPLEVDADPEPIPDELLQVPGFIDDVMNYTLDTAPYPERTLAFGGALSLQAFLAGRKVRDSADNRTNLYLLTLANSGGKDYPRRVNQKILVEIGLANCLGNAFASGEGIEDRMAQTPAALFQVDELDGLMQRVNQSKDARHEQIMNMLLQFYSCASNVYVMRSRAKQEQTIIDQPCLCLLGTAVPKHFYESISSRMLTNGFLARMLVLETPKRCRGREADVVPIPEPIITAAKWWTEFLPGDNAGNLSEWHPRPAVAKMTPEAGAEFAAFRARADEEYGLAEARTDSASMSVWARAYEKARRLALLYACSADRLNLTIEMPVAKWACATC